MIIGIGCDVVEHRITEELKWQSDIEMLKKIFSERELEFYVQEKTTRFIAGRFAAKEAILKCIGIGMEDGISLNDIEILKEKNGQPKIELSGNLKKTSDEMGISIWHLSITHSTSYSYAFVVAEKLKS